VVACVEIAPTNVPDSLLACEFGEAVTLPPGGVLRDSAGGGTFCVESRDGGTYVLVPFLAGARDTLALVTVGIQGGGLAAPPSTLDEATPALSEGALLSRSRLGTDDVRAFLEAADLGHSAFEARVSRELPDILGPATRPYSVDSSVGRALGPARTRVPASGEMMQMNASASCGRTDFRTGRVAAVSQHAIVVSDVQNPAGDPFSEEELEDFARDFDELVHPLITRSFGVETDLDGNGRVILFFTRAVNEVVPPGGGAGHAIGFFYRGDVFPRGGIPGRAEPCAGSNEGEVLYLAVPDPAGEVRGVPVTHTVLEQVMTGTIAHEMQHLVNASRRLHIVQAESFEETWLNEALSHVAEELMFYETTGLDPRQDIDSDKIYAEGSTGTEAFNRYMYGNLGRFDRFIQSPHDWSVMGKDGHETRGAAWSFLRYVADVDPGDDDALFRALVDGPFAGLDNLNAALGQDVLRLMEDWSVSVAVDGIDPLSSPSYQQPSWDLRELITALRLVDRRYPLRVLPVESRSPFLFELRTGSAGYPVFAARPGERAMVRVNSDGEGPERKLRMVLMRVR
jgi:hypothetical protein